MPIRHATLRQLAVFEAAARHLSFSRAAEALHLTQPAVSMQIRELESNAATPLFERVGKKLYLTTAGREVLRHARDVLRSIRDADDALDALRGLASGHLAIATTSTTKYFAPQLLARFRALHPAIEIRLAESNRETVIAELGANMVDLAIMGRPPLAPETIGTPFAPHPLVVIAAPEHPLAKRRRIPVEAVAREVFLVREQGSGTRIAMQQFFEEHGAAIRIGMEFASNETIKQAVMAGLGLSFLSRHTVSLELAARRLAVLDVRGLPVMREWFVVHLAAKDLSPLAQAFKTFVLVHGQAILKAHAGMR